VVFALKPVREPVNVPMADNAPRSNLLLSVVGVPDVLQQKPWEVMADVPKYETVPLSTAVVVVMLLAADVVTAGTSANVVKLTALP